MNNASMYCTYIYTYNVSKERLIEDFKKSSLHQSNLTYDIFGSSSKKVFNILNKNNELYNCRILGIFLLYI